MNHTQAETLASAFDYARGMSLSYFNKLRDTDIYHEMEVNGVKLNSPYWILGHLPVTENYLLLRSTGGEIVRFGWARPFGLGGSLPQESERVSLSEIEQTMKEVHDKALTHVRGLTDEQLKQPSIGGMKWGDGSIKDLIRHAIAHEASHAGHLGWLCKLNGIKTI